MDLLDHPSKPKAPILRTPQQPGRLPPPQSPRLCPLGREAESSASPAKPHVKSRALVFNFIPRGFWKLGSFHLPYLNFEVFVQASTSVQGFNFFGLRGCYKLVGMFEADDRSSGLL